MGVFKYILLIAAYILLLLIYNRNNKYMKKMLFGSSIVLLIFTFCKVMRLYSPHNSFLNGDKFINIYLLILTILLFLPLLIGEVYNLLCLYGNYKSNTKISWKFLIEIILALFLTVLSIFWYVIWVYAYVNMF